MEQRAPGEPEPLVNDAFDSWFSEVAYYKLVMSSNIFQSVFSHKSLKLPILFYDMRGTEIVDVGTLHAQSDKDLSSSVKPSPSFN